VVGGPIKINIAPLEPGQLLLETWRGQPIGILRRTETMLQNLDDVENRLVDPDSKQDQQPEYIDNQSRALKPEYLVLIMICTHLGCIPELVSEVGPQPYDENWLGGFYCPCHKSKFDLAGRVYKGVPAPLNLKVPPYRYIDDRTVEIGVDPEQIS
jgi:ubiquinol-cytochrome c reductase iron-sulfur subunit